MQRVLTRMQIAVATMNEELGNFAGVANMTNEAFSNLFREDSTEALLRFIEGLNDVERTGKNVTETLAGIGITEIRISDTLRRLAGSGDHVRQTIEMSNLAWEQNNALTREANIMYETSQSQQQILTNAKQNFAIVVGQQLNPALNIMRGSMAETITSTAGMIDNTSALIPIITTLVVTLGAGVGSIAAMTAGIKAYGVAKTVLTTVIGKATVAQKGFNLALLTSPAGKIVLALSLLAGAATAFAMAQGAANERQREAARLAEENARAQQETTSALRNYLVAFDELNNRRLKSSGLQETLVINEDLFALQNQINELIGSQADGIDLVNGNYREQLKLLQQITAESQRTELENARTALQSGRADAESNFEGLSRQVSSHEAMGHIHELARLQPLLEEAQAELDAFNEGTTELQRNLERLASGYFRVMLDFEYPDIAEQFFDPALAEQSAQAQKDAMVGIMTSLWDEYYWVFNEVANNPIEAVLLLRPDLDIDAIRENVARVVPELADELVTLLDFEDLRFVINLDYSDIEQFTGSTALEFVDLLRELQQVQDEVAQQDAFANMFNELTSQTSLVQAALNELRTTGKLSIETYRQFAEAGDEFNGVLSIQGGAVVALESDLVELNNTLVNTATSQAISNNATYGQIEQIVSHYIPAIRELASELDYMQSAYSVLTSAVDEFNEHGDLQISTILRLLEVNNDYLNLLEFTENGITLNTQAVYEKAEALREEMVAAQQAAVAEEIRGIIQNDVMKSTNEASGAADSFRSSLADVGAQALRTAQDYGVLAAAAVIANEAMNGADISGLSSGAADQIQSALNAAQNRINLINSWTSADTGGSGGGRTPGSRSSSSGSRGGGGSAGRTVEPFQAEIDATLQLESRLNEISNKLTEIDRQMANTPPDGHAPLLEERRRLLQEQVGLMQEINNYNRNILSEGVSRLAEHGIELTIDPVLNTVTFGQTVDEMQAIINGLSLGDQEQTNALRQEMQGILDTVISTNNAVAQQSARYRDIQQTIQQINLESVNLPFANAASEASRELEQLRRELDLLAQNDFERRLEIKNRQLEINRNQAANASQQIQALTQAYISGTISSQQFRTAIDEVNAALHQNATAARQAAEAALQLEMSHLNQQADALNQVVQMTVQLLRHEAQQEIGRLNDQLSAIQDRQNALRDIERQLNQQLQDRNRAIQDQIRGLNDALSVERNRIREVQAGLNEELRLARERARQQQQALADEMAGYRQIIDARRQALRREGEERSFGQDLAARQQEVARLEGRLSELQNNDSLAGQAERMRVEEALSEARQRLDNLVFDNEMRNRDQAYQNELARFQSENDAAQRQIQDQLRAYEDAHRERLALIDKEFEQRQRNNDAQIDALQRQQQAYADMIAQQIADLHRQSAEYDKQADGIRQNIQDIQDRISRNGYMTRRAMAEIDRDAEGVYARLKKWNAEFGSGIDADVSIPMRNFFDLVDTGTQGSLSFMEQTMQRIAEIQKEMVNNQHQLNQAIASQPVPPMGGGIRSHFEGMGHDVQWHGASNQFSISGQMFDAGQFSNIDGRLVATPQQMTQLERDMEELTRRLSNMNSFDKGGYIDRDQIARIHRGERVLTVDQNKAWESGKLTSLEITTTSMDNFANLLANGMRIDTGLAQSILPFADMPTNAHNMNTINNNNNAPIEINQAFHGVTSENFLRDVNGIMRDVAQTEINEYKRQEGLSTKANGLTRFRPR